MENKIIWSGKGETKFFEYLEYRFGITVPRRIIYDQQQCHYCGGDCELRIDQIKRTPPLGAIDLGIADDKPVIFCVHCGAQKDFAYSHLFGQCRCGSYKQDRSSYLPQVACDLQSYGCSNCRKCDLCSKPLRTWDFVETNVSYSHRHYDSDTDSKGIFSHVQCAGSNFQFALSHAENWVLECMRRIKSSEDEQNLRKQQKEQQITQQRLKAGQCVKCGRPLTFLQKLAGDTCASCR